jgi:hypothetical protein
MVTYLAIALIVTLSAGIAIGMIYAENLHLRRENAALKEAGAKHLPYPTAEAIENTFAALNAMEFEIAFKKELLDNARAHLGNARNGKGG